MHWLFRSPFLSYRKPSPTLFSSLTFFMLLSVFALLVACNPLSERGTRTLADIQAAGELVVLTRNAPTVRYLDRDEVYAGPEHDLVSAFAQAIGVTVRFVERDDLTEIINALAQGEADLAAAGLTVTTARKQRYVFAPPYQTVMQKVVCRRGGKQPAKLADLVGLELRVVANSSYVEMLTALKSDKVPDLSWETVEDVSTEQLLYEVWQKKFDCTLADSNILALNRRLMPELTAPLALGEAQSLAWMLPKRSETLEASVSQWLSEFKASGELSRWEERHYGFIDEYDYVDNKKLHARVKERYQPHAHIFEAAAKKYDLPVSLLAAQSYQESHWRPKAKSPTGVRGMMMLTRATAKSLGIENRLDVQQSIEGGARYLNAMKARFSDDVQEPDLTWLALAAYNIGRAHMHDAQSLARSKGLDPYKWHDVKSVLPLLAQPKVYKKLKYGYARGHEPVQYVQRIREYQHVLETLLGENPNLGVSREKAVNKI